MLSFLSEAKMQSGQVGIIILLIVVVMSTIGISVVSRSSTDVSLSKGSEDANRAFDAAESGAESALSDNSALDPSNSNTVTGTIGTIPNVNVNYTVDKLNILSATIDEGFSASLDVRGAPPGGSVLIDWASETNCISQNPASLVITVYSLAGTSPPYRKYYAGACAHSPSDNFTIAPPSGTQGYFRQTSVPLVGTDALLRVRAVYNQTKLRIASVGWSLPVQQFKVTSTAQSAANKETKALQVDRTLPMSPSVLDFTLFAGGNISNN